MVSLHGTYHSDESKLWLRALLLLASKAITNQNYIKRKKETDPIQDKHRLAAIDLACKSAEGPPGWLRSEPRGVSFTSAGRMIQTLQDKRHGVTIFNVVGANSVVKLCRNGSKFLQPMVVVGRAGSNNKVVQETAENSEAAGASVYYVEELAGNIRSVDALAALKENDEELLRTFVPASVADYLIRNYYTLFGENHVPTVKAAKFVPSRGERYFSVYEDGPDKSAFVESKPERPGPGSRASRSKDSKGGTNSAEEKPKDLAETATLDKQRQPKLGAKGYSGVTTSEVSMPKVAAVVEEVTAKHAVGSEQIDRTSQDEVPLPERKGASLGMGFSGELSLGGRPALVVAVTGAPSAGKSSLAQELQYMLWERHGTRSNLMIAQHDFDLGHSAGTGAWIWERHQWLSYWESPDATDWESMEQEVLEAIKEYPIVIVEGHCLFSSDRLRRLLNCLVWLDVEQEECWNRRTQYPKGWEPAHYFYKCLWPGHEEHMSLALGVQKTAPGCDGKSASIGPGRSLGLNGLDQPAALRERALNAIFRWMSSTPLTNLAPSRPLQAGPLMTQCQ